VGGADGAGENSAAPETPRSEKLFSASSRELIVVDDGSTDRTPAILAEFAARDPRVIVLTQENQGQAAALNRGLAEATTDWVAIHDHDDVSLPQRLERQLEYLSGHPDVCVLGTNAVEIDASGREIGHLQFGPASISDFVNARQHGALFFPPHPSVMLHRPTILQLGAYDPSFGSAADVELWSRVADHHPVVVLPETLIRYRIHGESMSFVKAFEQRSFLRWIRRRQEARRCGGPIPTLGEHESWEHGRFGLRGLNFARCDWAFLLLRRARLANLSNHKPHAFLLLAGAVVLAPESTAKRIGAHARRTRRIA